MSRQIRRYKLKWDGLADFVSLHSDKNPANLKCFSVFPERRQLVPLLLGQLALRGAVSGRVGQVALLVEVRLEEGEVVVLLLLLLVTAAAMAGGRGIPAQHRSMFT